jgi:hypothetical protein
MANLPNSMPCLMLRDRNREPALFHANVKDVVTLFVKSRTRGKAVLDTTFGGRGDRNIPLVTLTPMALEIALRDLPNRVCRDAL